MPGSPSHPAGRCAGKIVVGAPVGSAEFFRAFLTEARAQLRLHLRSLASLADTEHNQNATQVQMALLRLCANTGLDYSMRTFPPPFTEHAALEHVAAVDACLSDILACPHQPPACMLAALHQARLPISMGGLGVSSAHDTRRAA
eukprot:6199053-Pleurochrysis_carterae.AAC.1